METNQENELLEGWKKINDEDKRTILFYMKFLLEKQRPSYQEEKAAEAEAYRLQLVKARELKSRIEKVAMDTRRMICNNLPKKMHFLPGDFEILLFLMYEAEYEPYSLFREDNATVKLANKLLRSVPRNLAKLERPA